MARKFEVFGGGRRYVKGARVTLTHRGFFLFSSAALKLLGNPEAVVYLYDRASQAVAFAPSTRATPHAYAVSTSHGSKAGQTCAVAFCKHYGIDFRQGIRCQAEMEEGRLVIELPKGTRV